MKKSLISVGTNSTRALVAEIGDGSPHALLQRSTGTRIGEGLKERGHIGEEPMQRTLEAIRDHLHAVKAYTSNLQVIATSAVRRADNSDLFVQRVREITNVTPQIISGEEEANCSYTGAVSGIENASKRRYGVADLGGGSTEYAIGIGTRPQRVISCEIGAVRLTEAVPALNGAHGEITQAEIDRAKNLSFDATSALADFEPVDRLIFVGGTATTVIWLLWGNRDLFEYADLSRSDLSHAIEQLRALDLEARKRLPGMNPQRADILLAGSLILEVLFERIGHDRAAVSTNDVLMGFLLSSS